MAKIVSVVDDFDHTTLASETMVFAFDGEAYSIDLSEDNAAEFRELMARYREVATKLGKHKIDKQSANGKRVAAAARSQTALALPTSDKPWYKIDRDGDPATEKAKKRYREMARQFGIDNGWNLGVRGVIPEDVYVAFEQHRIQQGLPVGPAAVGLG